MLRFAQHDIDEVARIATQSLKREEINKFSVGEGELTSVLGCVDLIPFLNQKIEISFF
jgi:hypothetical protein